MFEKTKINEKEAGVGPLKKIVMSCFVLKWIASFNTFVPIMVIKKASPKLTKPE